MVTDLFLDKIIRTVGFGCRGNKELPYRKKAVITSGTIQKQRTFFCQQGSLQSQGADFSVMCMDVGSGI